MGQFHIKIRLLAASFGALLLGASPPPARAAPGEGEYRLCRSVHGRTTCLIFEKSCERGVWVDLGGTRQRCEWFEQPSQCLTARASLDDFARARGTRAADVRREIARSLAANPRCNPYSLATPEAFVQACAPAPDARERAVAEEFRKLWAEIRHACGEKASLGGRR